MIFEPLRRAWMRLFGRGATSVSPLFDQKPPGEPWGQMTLMGVSYDFDAPRIEPTPPGPWWVDPRQRGAEPEPIGSTMVRFVDRQGIEPPGNEMPWPDWRKLERELAAPAGWSACRFPTWRPGDEPGGEQAGLCAFVFGITRGDFGVWCSPFAVCTTDDDGILTDRREDVLAAVTHLPSGLGMGIFADREAAVANVLIVEKLGIDWRAKKQLIEDYARVQQARAFAGITICRGRHAHIGSPEGPRVAIWERTAAAVAEGRPERLS